MRNQKGTSEIIMNNIEFEREVAELIGRRTEGEYWDFKQQWYLNNTDLLHDIICMANSPVNRDCYIIIGIEDNLYKYRNKKTITGKAEKARDCLGIKMIER